MLPLDVVLDLVEGQGFHAGDADHPEIAGWGNNIGHHIPPLLYIHVRVHVRLGLSAIDVLVHPFPEGQGFSLGVPLILFEVVVRRTPILVFRHAPNRTLRLADITVRLKPAGRVEMRTAPAHEHQLSLLLWIHQHVWGAGEHGVAGVVAAQLLW